MNKLSVIILTKNEEKNIVAVIENAKQVADEVLIVDSGSTDATVELAKGLGAKVVFRAWDNDFAAQRNFALEQTECEWVLYLDADERMNGEFIKNIKEILSGGHNLKQYAMTRRVVAFNFTFKHGIFAPDLAWRMFPRTSVTWQNKVHERPVCDLAKAVIGGYVEHYTYDSWAQWLNKVNQYTSIWAKDNYDRGKRIKPSSGFFHAIAGFLKAYFWQKGFLDGWMGLYSSYQHFIYTLLKYLKLWEVQKGKERNG